MKKLLYTVNDLGITYKIWRIKIPWGYKTVQTIHPNRSYEKARDITGA